MSSKEIVISQWSNGIGLIQINQPKKKNALSLDNFREITEVLTRAASDDSIKIVALTGAGDYFSSGNDLSNFIRPEVQNLSWEEAAELGASVFKGMVKAMITFPKILIALVNGPSVGIMVTTLPLFDVVYCSDTANFYTPFAKLGQCCEGASSYTFPRIMPRGAALEMLCFDGRMTASEAKIRGLVTDVFPAEHFHQQGLEKLKAFAQWPKTTLMATKKLTRKWDMEKLLQANEEEANTLKSLWATEECLDSVMKFLTERQKSKI